MRTTLTIDDDVLDAIRERAGREGRTAGEVLSDIVRAALTATSDGHQRSATGFALLPSRRRTVTNSLVERLRDEDHE